MADSLVETSWDAPEEVVEVDPAPVVAEESAPALDEAVRIAQAKAEGPKSVVSVAEGVEGPVYVSVGGLDVEHVERAYVDEYGRVVVDGSVEVHSDAAALLNAIPSVAVEVVE